MRMRSIFRGLAMWLWKWVLLYMLLVVSSVAKKQKLEIITESKPEDCTRLAEKGDTLTVHYTGALQDGQVFDSSRKEGREPFSIKLGAGQVIPGWDQGLVGMCVGEVRKLIIPPHLGYGDQGVPGVIPGGAILMFSIELLDLQKPSALNIFSVQREFWVYLGGFALFVWLGYELYRRAVKQNEDLKKKKPTPSKKSQSKKKK